MWNRNNLGSKPQSVTELIDKIHSFMDDTSIYFLNRIDIRMEIGYRGTSISLRKIVFVFQDLTLSPETGGEIKRDP